MSVLLSVYISAASTWRIYVKFAVGDYYENLSRKIHIWLKLEKKIGHFTCRLKYVILLKRCLRVKWYKVVRRYKQNAKAPQCYAHCLFCYFLQRVRGLCSNTVRSNTFCRSYLALGYSEPVVSSRLMRHKWETIDPYVCLSDWLSVFTIHIRSSCRQNRHYFSLVHLRWIHSSNIIVHICRPPILFVFFLQWILFYSKTFTFFNVLDHRTHTIRIVTSKRRKRECDIITLFGRQISFCLCLSLRARKCVS